MEGSIGRLHNSPAEEDGGDARLTQRDRPDRPYGRTEGFAARSGTVVCAAEEAGAARGAAPGPFYLRREYGDWFVGFSETPRPLALVWTAPGVLPSFRPITRVGVFSRASWRRACLSLGVQGLPVLRVDFGMWCFLLPVAYRLVAR